MIREEEEVVMLGDKKVLKMSVGLHDLQKVLLDKFKEQSQLKVAEGEHQDYLQNSADLLASAEIFSVQTDPYNPMRLFLYFTEKES